MSFFSSFFHGLARMLTLPKAVRDEIKANPITNLAQQEIIAEGMTALGAAIDRNAPPGSGTNAALKMAAQSALEHSGISTSPPTITRASQLRSTPTSFIK